MSMVFALLIDLYIAAVVLDWLLTFRCLHVEPGLRARLRGVVEPFLGWIQSAIRPSCNGVSMTRVIAVVLLLVARAAVTAVLP